MFINTKASFPVSNGYAPKEGPKALPIDLDFSTEPQVALNLQTEAEADIFQTIQSIYIDNTSNTNELILTVSVTGQIITCAAGGSGTWPIIALRDVGFKGSFTTTPQAGLVVNVILLNVPMASAQFGAVTVNANIIPIAPGVITDFSSTITVANTSQIAIPANANRKGFIIGNPINSTPENLFINFTTPASTSAFNSIEITPGNSYELLGPAIPTDAINIVALTASHAFIAKEIT